MIGYLQLQNFILNDKDHKISNIIQKDFKSFCDNKKIKILNPFSNSFHNGKINDLKVLTINIFNEYLNKDPRIINLLNNTNSCTNHFYEALKKDKLIQNFIEFNFNEIYSYLNYRNINLAESFLKLKNDKNYVSNGYNPFLSFIEEYFIEKESYYYYYKILNIKEIFENFIDYISIEFEKDTSLNLDPVFINELKHHKNIQKQYMDLLFKDNAIENLFNIFNEETNNTAIFYRLKKKYYKKFLIKKYPNLDIKLIENYRESELFHNNMMIYLTKKQ